MLDERESWDSYFMRMALAVADRGTCPRRKVGALLTQSNRVRATGYNGSPSGQPHCFDEGCLLNEEGRCKRTIHAEVNLLLDAMPHQLTGGIVWVTDQPCPDCAQALSGAPIQRVVYLRPYHDHLRKQSADILESAGIELVQYQPQRPGDLEAFEA